MILKKIKLNLTFNYVQKYAKQFKILEKKIKTFVADSIKKKLSTRQQIRLSNFVYSNDSKLFDTKIEKNIDVCLFLQNLKTI